MTIRQKLFVLRCVFLCAVIFPFVGTAPVFAQARGGVLVQPNGVLSRDANLDVGNRLADQRVNAARATYSLARDVSAKSPMRCVSLNRLEKSIIAANGTMTEEMKYLAGIQRITHVFYFADSKDIVIAGPAEGWFPGYEGTMIGVETLQPVCELQHLITALRAYAPKGDGAGIVGCSIDPTPEGIARLQTFTARSTRLTRPQFVQGVRNNIGMQVIQVDGVPATTHAAQMMVAADYRMKRIGLGLDTIRVPGLETFIGHTEPGAANALFRWYFVPDYDSVILTEDRTGMELVGDGVKLIGENEVVVAGQRMAVEGALDPGSKAFTESFTKQYPHIAKQALVFAQLRNWIDMLICAAHIQREDFYGQSGWSMEFFGSEEKYPLETFVAPKTVAPVVGERVVRNLVLAPVGGGIVIDADVALDEENAKLDKDGKIAQRQKQITLSLPEGVWWWDVK